jgi:hypothetical protein
MIECAASDVESNFECDDDGTTLLREDACEDETTAVRECFEGSVTTLSQAELECGDYCTSPLGQCVMADATLDECLDECQTFSPSVSPCGEAWQAALDCLNDMEGSWECVDGEPVSDTVICEEETLAYAECASAMPVDGR